MKSVLSIAAAVALLSTSALALNDNEAHGNGNYVGNTYDNHGVNNNTTNAINGSFNTNSGNRTYDHSRTSNSNENNNRLANKQGQGQSQGQGQGQSVENSGNSGSASSVDGGNSSNNYVNNYPRQPVSSAIAAPLTASDDTCMGSTSAGGQGVGFGLSLGSTWTDKDCVRRKNARELYNMGKKKVALNLLCRDEEIAAAFWRDAGDYSCPQKVSLQESIDTSSAPAQSEYPTQHRKGSRR